MKSGWMLWAIAALSLGCGRESPTETIRIGAILSTTGDLANIGSDQLDAVALAVEQINERGGVLGLDLEIVARDDGTDASRGRSAAETLVAARVPAVIGATGSAISLAVSEVLATAGIVQVSASSTSPLLTSAADQGTLFRTCPSDALQGRLLARRAKERGYSRVAVIHIPGAYGSGLSGEFKTAFEAADGTVTGAYEYTEAQQSYSTLLAEVFANAPQAVVLVAYPIDGAQIIKDYLSSLSGEGAYWFFTDALQDSGFVTAVGASNFTFGHEGTGASSPSGARFEAYAAEFERLLGRPVQPGTFAPQAYDAVYLLALAMEAADSAEASELKQRLAAVSAGGEVFGPDQYEAAVAAARAGKDLNYEGVSGNVDLDAAGDTLAPYDLWKVSEGLITVVEAGVNP